MAQVLGYENQNRDIQRHVDEEDRVLLGEKTQYQIGIEFDYKALGQRGGWLINESGLYSLILSSKLPGAKKFKWWVTSEVLPSIRRNGGYIAGQNRTKFVRGFIIFQASPFQKHPACFPLPPPAYQHLVLNA